MRNEVKFVSGGRKLFLFMMTSLDGYMEGSDHDLSWHNVDSEFNDFAAEQLGSADTILFGRRTYQLMESFWPGPQGLQGDSVVAKYMNMTPKVVFSHSLDKVTETEHWKNVRLVKDNISQEVNNLKQQESKDLVILGSNNFCVTLLEEGLLDEIRIMVNPVAIGQGTPLFAGLKEKVSFQLTNTRTFHNGNVLLTYIVTKI